MLQQHECTITRACNELIYVFLYAIMFSVFHSIEDVFLTFCFNSDVGNDDSDGSSIECATNLFRPIHTACADDPKIILFIYVHILSGFRKIKHMRARTSLFVLICVCSCVCMGRNMLLVD